MRTFTSLVKGILSVGLSMSLLSTSAYAEQNSTDDTSQTDTGTVYSYEYIPVTVYDVIAEKNQSLSLLEEHFPIRWD